MKPLAGMRLLARLDWCEVDGALAPDARRVLRGERDLVSAAMRSRDPRAIARAVAEARSVARMWGVEL